MLAFSMEITHLTETSSWEAKCGVEVAWLGNLLSQLPIKRAYRLRAVETSVVPCTSARPSAKTVTV